MLVGFFIFLLQIIDIQCQTTAFVDFGTMERFKVLMAYFNEAFLNGAQIKEIFFEHYINVLDQKRFKGSPLEGAQSLEIPNTISNTIRDQNPDSMISKELRDFGKALELGIQLMKRAPMRWADWADLNRKAVQFQTDLLEQLKRNSRIVVPFFWSGKDPHAISLIFEETQDETINFIVVNTGDGLNFHFTIPDPDNVYPWFKRLWIEFKGIPKGEIFDEKDAWFMQVLLRLCNFEQVRGIEEISESASIYFYGSVLPNLKKYLVKSSNLQEDTKLIPAQRSGTCTLSSIMASFLYYAEDVVSFNYNRVVLGHTLIKEFLDSMQTSPNFITLITDGFDLVARRLFRSTASALAQQLLLFLEVKHPKAFKHIGLFGVGRSSWIQNRKALAIKTLKEDLATLKLLQVTIDLANRILVILHENPVNLETSLLSIDPETRKIPENDFIETNDEPKFNGNSGVHYFSFLRDPIDRLNKKFDSPEFILVGLEACLLQEDLKVFTCVIDVFRMTTRKDWWMWMEFNNKSYEFYLKFLKVLSTISKRFLASHKTATSFDDLVMLAHLQLGMWKCALLYDDLFADVKLNLKDFAPPQIVNQVFSKSLNKGYFTITSGMYDNWPIKTSFTASNAQELLYLLNAYDTHFNNSNATERFLGPGDFFTSQCAIQWSPKAAYDRIMASKGSRAMYSLMFKFCQMDLENLRKNNSKATKEPKWTSEPHALYILFLSNENLFSNHFPHFFTLMNGLTWTFQGLGRRPCYSYGPESAFDSSQTFLDELKMTHRYADNFPFSLYNGQGIFNLSLIPGCRELKIGDHTNNLFFQLRHSAALTNPGNIINFESWLNYIKSAQDASIMEYPYFSYLSDRMLNMPRIDLDQISKVSNANDIIDCTYPEGFNAQIHAHEIIDSLIRLINGDLNYIIEKQGRLEVSEKTKLVKRAVHVAIPLVRFLARLDFDAQLDAKFISHTLADIYGIFYKFAPLGNTFAFSDSDVSLVNLVLAQISALPIRNPKSFLDALNIADLPDGLERFRKSLLRVHWFITKAFFIRNSSTVMSHSDDLFNRGFIYNHVDGREVPFMNFLLKSLFLHKHDSTLSNWSKISYSPGQDIVLMNSKSNEMTLAIQLSSGKIVKNGNLQVERQSMLNSAVFKEYFDTPERQDSALKNGEIAKVGYIVVYIVTDYLVQGNTIVLLCNSSCENCSLYRKISHGHGGWYRFYQKKDQFMDAFKYKWIHQHRIYYKQIIRRSKTEFILMADDQLQYTPPLLEIQSNFRKNIIKIADFHEDKEEKESWILLEHYPSGAIWDRIQKHLRRFTCTDFLIAKTSSTGRLVFIFPGLRMKEDPDRPLTLLEDSIDGEFHILNVPGLIVSRQQSLAHGIGIAGTLIVYHHREGHESNNDQKYILAPLHENDPNKIDFKGPPQLIEMFPIASNLPAPQTRLQRLLLAYHCIKAWEYDLAREFLQPYISIDQNEVFSVMELTVISWISRIKAGGPEAEALKLVAFAHSYSNRNKFPLEYISDPTDKSSQEGIVRSERFNLLESSKNAQSGAFLGYSMSIRDISEKFYLHRILANELNPLEMVKSLNPNSSIPSTPVEVTKFELVCTCSMDFDIRKLRTDLISSSTIFSLFMARKKRGIVYPGSSYKAYLKLMPKLMHRQKRGTGYTSKQNEMLVHCLAKDPDSWDTIVDEALAYCDSFDQEVSEMNRINDLITAKIGKCFDSYKDDFEGINLSILPSSTKTIPSRLAETILADIKDTKQMAESQKQTKEFKLVHTRDLDTFNRIHASLCIILKKDIHESSPNKEPPSAFNEDTLKASPVLEKLNNSISAFLNSHSSCGTSLDAGEFSKFSNEMDTFLFYLESRIHEIKLKLYKIAQDFIFITDNSPNESGYIQSLLRLMHRRKQKTFANIYACYQAKSVSCLQAKFPQLNLKECENILEEAAIFYGNQILLDYFTLLAEMIEALRSMKRNEKSISSDDLSALMDEIEKIQDFNSRLQSPTILNFEYRSRAYRLRREQVADISLLTTLDPSTKLFKSNVIQRMMAAGKTLVLGTIAVITKATDPEKLSILVPPASLYQSNLSAMQARTYGFFKTRGNNFIFPRFQFTNDEEEMKQILVPFLESIIEDIERTMKMRQYYILSPDSLQSFLNGYIEMINHATSNSQSNLSDSLVKVLNLYAKIYEIFRKKSSIILDEIDMTMDPKKELNFPTVDNEPFNMLAVVLITDLIEFSLFDPEITDQIKLDILGNNQASFPTADFTKYREALFKHIESELKEKNKAIKSLWSSLVINDDTSPEKIIKFLCNPDISFMKPWISSIHASGNRRVADALVIVKMQLWKGLQEALNASANLNYGTVGANREWVLYAVPYLAANTPSPSSEFADRWETLEKTLLMLSSAPCAELIAKRMISYIRKCAVRETNLETSISQTVTSKNFALLIKGMSLMDLNDQNSSHVTLMHQALAVRSPVAIRFLFAFAVDEIFNYMKFPIEQITSNALNMTSMFGSVQGYSGTIDNVNILPQEVIVAAYENHILNEKNNGGIAHKLIADSKNGFVFQLTDQEMKGSSATRIIKAILKGAGISEEQIVSAIIDTGAFFKNFKNRHVAAAILKIFKASIDIVLYYDEESNQVQFIKSSRGASSYSIGFISSTDPKDILKATQTDISRRFTYYDQRHITGTDILQPKEAYALMTVGPQVLLRDILQGTLRMRQFMTSQRVILVTSESTTKFYFSKGKQALAKDIRVTDLLALGAANEDEKQAVENERLAFAKIDNEVRRFVLDHISQVIVNGGNPTNTRMTISAWMAPEKKVNNRRSIRDLFIKLIRENPIEWMVLSQQKDSESVLKGYTKYWLDRLREKASSSTSAMKQLDFSCLERTLECMTKSTNEKDSLLSFLGPKITDRIGFSDAGGSEVQMQVFMQQLVEFDLDKMTQKFKKTPLASPRTYRFSLKPFVEARKPSMNLSKRLEEYTPTLRRIMWHPKMPDTHKEIASAALLTRGRRVFVSRDLLELIRDPESSVMIFSKYTLEASHFLVQVLPEKMGVRVILLSPESANEFRDAFLRKSREDALLMESKFWLCDLSGRVGLSNDEASGPGSNVLDFIPAVRGPWFDGLLFNGSFDQIISSPHLNRIYREEWLKNRDFQLRAKFLLLRMHLLAQKASAIFAPNNADLEILNRASRGDKDALTSVVFTSSAYQKDAVSSSLQAKFKQKKITSQDKTTNPVVNPREIFDQITGNNSFETSNFTDDVDVRFEDLNSNISLETDSISSSSDNSSILPSITTTTEWLDVQEDPKDFNDRDDTSTSNDDEDETEQVPNLFAELFYPILIVIFISIGGAYYIKRSRKTAAVQDNNTGEGDYYCEEMLDNNENDLIGDESIKIVNDYSVNQE